MAEFQATDPATGKPYADDFGWISHTYDTPYLDVGCATQDYIEAELNENSTSIAALPGTTPGTGGLGLTESTDDTWPTELKIPRFSCPGTIPVSPTSSRATRPPVDEPDLDDESAGTGGTLAAGTYQYAVTDQFTAAPVSSTAGESAAFVTGPVTVAANGSVGLTWQAICHAANYNIYRQLCTDSTCSSGNGWALIGNYYTPAEATLPDNSSADASAASTTSVTGAGEQELTFTDTGASGAECDGSAPGGGTYCVTAGPPPGLHHPSQKTPWNRPGSKTLTSSRRWRPLALPRSALTPPSPIPTRPRTSSVSACRIRERSTPPAKPSLTVRPRSSLAIRLNIFYNASTEAQELDEFNTLYSSQLGTSTFAAVVNSVVSQMLQFMLTNNPEPSYVHQTNIMGIPPGCTDATWPSNCTVTATSGTPAGHRRHDRRRACSTRCSTPCYLSTTAISAPPRHTSS